MNHALDRNHSQVKRLSTPDMWLSLHSRLADFNAFRLTPRHDADADDRWESRLKAEYALRTLEGRFVEAERGQVAEAAAEAPSDAAGFVNWFAQLEQHGPGQGDALFPWLAEHADRAQMTWFLEQELAGEAGFDDLVAMTQVKLPVQAKLELARNYWDEMGRGHRSGMHGPMLAHLAREFDITPGGDVVWESLALGNLMVALAANRRYAFQAIGALGVIELTAPGRATLVNQGLKRLGVSAEARRYFAVHATLDRKHYASWSSEVLRPIVEADPAACRAIAEGALMRLRAGARCFARYRKTLRVPHADAGLSITANSQVSEALQSPL